MGAAIAAHCANVGLEVELLDAAPDDPEADRNEVVKKGFDAMKKAKPAALMSEGVASRIRTGNFTDHLECVGEADWVVEAIVERPEPKRDLFARIEPLLKDGVIVSSNTSGIPLHTIAEGFSEGFRRRFLGTHFFNPPRYLKLLELIPTADTDPEVVETMRRFGERILGKGPVVAKDTPGFIGNRLGTFTGMQAMSYALDNGYGVEEVDTITGPLVGRPKTATFRLVDQVGLDVMVGVAENLYEAVPNDESREQFNPHPTLKEMQRQNLLGLKTGAGFYKRNRRDGQTVFDVLDVESFEYSPPEEPEIPVAGEARRKGGLGERLKFLISEAEEDSHARYVRDTLLPYLAYASRRVPEISDTLEDVDSAMEWGFGHEAGPFRTWDVLGVRETVETMDTLGIEIAPWVRGMLDAGNEGFYRRENGRELSYDPVKKEHHPIREVPLFISLDRMREDGRELERNDSASLLDLGDGVMCFEFHCRGNTIDRDVLEMGRRALAALEREDVVGLVVGNGGRNFCAGANLGEISYALQNGMPGEVEKMIEGVQGLLMGFRFAPNPVVAAPHGQTLGGGAEVCLHADRIVAAAETYIGLVETGVGIIPAGGGTKELARRLISPAMRTKETPPLPFAQRAFETIALAKVASSALEAREMGFLTEDDPVVMNADHLLYAAKREVLELAEDYIPPERESSVYAAGPGVRAALEVGVRTLQWGHYATEHDGVIGGHLARALTGGGISAPQWVPEEYVLGLEKEAFMMLLKEPKTQERIGAMLETGKPLRN
jgi:3-hydroxyacyl-CoA dehydrogenase